MTKLFNDIVTRITNAITGLDPHNLDLSTVFTYVDVRCDVKIWINVVCLVLLVAITTGIGYAVGYLIGKRKNTNKTH